VSITKFPNILKQLWRQKEGLSICAVVLADSGYDIVKFWAREDQRNIRIIVGERSDRNPLLSSELDWS
jgi:hypothetical protein